MSERELLLLQNEYWSQAARDPELRARHAGRRAKLRAALARALPTRLEHLGAPPGAIAGEAAAATRESPIRSTEGPLTPEQQMEDHDAVMAAAGLTRAALSGAVEAPPARR